MDEGVDEQVLLELRHSWELKLKTTKAVEVPKPEPDPQPPTINSASQQASSKCMYPLLFIYLFRNA